MAWTEAALAEALGRVLSPAQVLAGATAARAYDCDAYTVDRSAPAAVVFPTSTYEVARVVRWCNENQVPFTPRGAGTGLSGGAMPALGGVVISLKKMTRILVTDIPNRRLKAECGIANLRITDAVRAEGFHFAPDPSSQSVSSLGGNIAENSGGPHTLKYGVTYPHILGMTWVAPDGSVHEIGGGAPGGPGIDLMALMVGAEGTLGVVTEAWVRLTPIPTVVETVLASFPTIRDATECVSAIMNSGVLPAALEMVDGRILEALKLAFGLEFPPEAAALLLVECDGADAVQEIVQVEACCDRHHAILVERAESEEHRKKLWTARKKGVGAMGRLAPSIVTHDGVIPRSKLPEMLEFVYAVAAEKGVGIANIFHAGDGNLHPCMYFDDRDPKQVQAVVEAGELIIRRCLELGGSVTGEHGVGVEKASLLKLMFSPDDLTLQEQCKRALGPGTLCNPCKVFPDQRGCVEHMSRWRGVAT